MYRFGDYELDVAARQLTGPDGVIHLEPQVFDVLVHLVENRVSAPECRSGLSTNDGRIAFDG